MDFWSSLSGMVEFRLTSADPAGAMGAISKAGIELFHACPQGELTICALVRRKDYKRLRRLAKKRGETVVIIRREGSYWTFRGLIRRPVLLMGIALICFLTLYLPSRILFVEVEGNCNVPAFLILEKAEECGLNFGVSRRQIRSERLKNALLQAVPELQWAGINTYGCRAVISVRERPSEEDIQEKGSVSSVVATRDGVISEITVYSGNRLCVPGQAVKAGEVLISGYTDCGICVRATHAQGEVFAHTQRSLTAVMPLQYAQKGQIQKQTKKYSLLLGKKLINFSKDSGISTAGCDKMYSVKYITLPGNLRLPLALVTETIVSYDTSSESMDEEKAQEILTSFSSEYLYHTMIAGHITQRYEIIQPNDEICILHGRYACVEMIGKTRIEENILGHGETH